MAKISELIKILKGEGDVAAVRRAERIGDEAPYAAERIDATTSATYTKSRDVSPSP